MNRKVIIALLTSTITIVALTSEAQAPPQTTTALHFDWDAGYRQVTVDQDATVVSSEIVLQLRDAEGNVVSEQRQPVTDCLPAYDAPSSGICGSEVVFTMTLPHEGHWEKWARGEWTFSNGMVITYTVPFSPSVEIDAEGFALMEILEWYDLCPQDPPAPTPYPVQPTYTPLPTPTCLPTATPPPPLPTPTPYPTQTPWPTQPPLR